MVPYSPGPDVLVILFLSVNSLGQCISDGRFKIIYELY